MVNIMHYVKHILGYTMEVYNTSMVMPILYFHCKAQTLTTSLIIFEIINKTISYSNQSKLIVVFLYDTDSHVYLVTSYNNNNN